MKPVKAWAVIRVGKIINHKDRFCVHKLKADALAFALDGEQIIKVEIYEVKK